MPKAKKINEKTEKIMPKKVVQKTDEEEDEKEVDTDLILGEEGEEIDEEEEMLDEEDVDPFHDKWEE